MSETSNQLAHLHYHINLLKALYNQLQQRADKATQEHSPMLPLLDALEQVIHVLEAHRHDALPLGQQWVEALLRSQPELMPLVNRDLLWFFGGDCLHYMEDEEIARYQQLDELRFDADKRGELFSREAAKARLFGLH